MSLTQSVVSAVRKAMWQDTSSRSQRRYAELHGSAPRGVRQLLHKYQTMHCIADERNAQKRHASSAVFPGKQKRLVVVSDWSLPCFACVPVPPVRGRDFRVMPISSLSFSMASVISSKTASILSMTAALQTCQSCLSGRILVGRLPYLGYGRGSTRSAGRKSLCSIS